jgi:hypothetical protein
MLNLARREDAALGRHESFCRLEYGISALPKAIIMAQAIQPLGLSKTETTF